MNKTLTLPAAVYRKLAKGATERGMSVEALLAIVSDLVVLPDQATDEDRQRSKIIDRLLDRSRANALSATDQRLLAELIDADYQAANARADRAIRAKERRARNGRSSDKSRK